MHLSRIFIRGMKNKESRLDAIKLIISSQEIGSQDEMLQELHKEGYNVTQATLSRDLKQLKVAKAANINGQYVYVLPNDVMYKRTTEMDVSEMLMSTGFISLDFSGNMAVFKTKPGYASSMAYDIDNYEVENPNNPILGTIAGDDTILLILKEGVIHRKVKEFLSQIIPNIQ